MRICIIQGMSFTQRALRFRIRVRAKTTYELRLTVKVVTRIDMPNTL